MIDNEKFIGIVIFRLSVLALVLLACDSIYSWWLWKNMEPHIAELMSLNGLNAILTLPEYLFVLYPYIQMAVMLSIIFRLPKAHLLFVFNVAFFEIVYLLGGIGISQPIQGHLGALISYTYGGLLLALFLQHRNRRIDKAAAG